jgi:hypothetical protein
MRVDFIHLCPNICYSKKIQWDIIKKSIGLHVKYPLLCWDFNDNWIFSTDFRKILKFQIKWKSI